MAFKIKIDKYNLAVLILGAVILLLIVFGGWKFYESSELKKQIKENNKKIEKLEAEKIPLLAAIEKDGTLIAKRDSAILDLTNRQEELQTTLKRYENENRRLKNSYSNSSTDERIKLFARLATETDSLR